MATSTHTINPLTDNLTTSLPTDSLTTIPRMINPPTISRLLALEVDSWAAAVVSTDSKTRPLTSPRLARLQTTVLLLMATPVSKVSVCLGFPCKTKATGGPSRLNAIEIG